MTKEFRITSDDFKVIGDGIDDCYIAPDDPVHELKRSNLGGLGGRVALEKYVALQPQPSITGSDNGRIQREQNIKAGTKEWFDLWFPRKQW
jgi:hypothetical protein